MRCTATRVVYFLVFTSLLTGVLVVVKGLVSQVPATGTWISAGNMSSARSGASTVLLQDGRLLIAGGDAGSGALPSAEIFDSSGAFSLAAPMSTPRSRHTATVLGDGRVLVAGGVDSSGNASATAEVYDPTANTWTPTTGPLIRARSGQTASLLSDGTVLIAGGDSSGAALSSLEIFNPANGTFTAVAATLSSPRESHAAAVLAKGQVLIVGGTDGTNALASSDIYDPSTGLISAGPVLSTPRQGLSATTQLDGNVLVVGGNNGVQNGSQDLASGEVYDPSAGTFTLTGSLATAREGHLAFLLPHNNGILIVGGTSAGAAGSSSELYYPWTGAFNPTGAMASARASATGSPLGQDGLLFVAGGNDATGAAQSSAELYGFATVTTDKSDYAPGQTVTIRGSGWQPGETVTLAIVESPSLDTHGPFTTVADASGNLYNTDFSPDQHDVSVRFTLTATGSASQAQTTFTDAPPAINVSRQLPHGGTLHVASSVALTVEFQVQNPLNGASQSDVGTYTLTYTNSGTHALTPTGSTPASGTAIAFNLGPNTSIFPTFTFTAPAAAGNSTITLTANVSTVAGSACSPAFNCSDTKSYTIAVVTSLTPTNLAVSAASGSFGGTTTLSATLTNANTNLTISGESVDFFLNGNFVGSATTSSGVATLSNVSLVGIVAGTYPGGVLANFAGDTTYSASTGSNTLTVTGATQLAFTTSPVSGNSGTCLGAITVQTQTSGGTAVNPSTAVQVDLSILSGGTGGFFSDNVCSSAITNVSIPTSGNSASFYFKGTSAGSPIIQAADHGGVLTAATQTESISAVPTTLTLDAPSPNSVLVGSTGPVTFTAHLTQTSGGAAVVGATIHFSVDNTDVATTATTDGTGTATLSTYDPSALTAGGHNVQASFTAAIVSGIAFSGSTSGTQTLTVNKRATSTSVSLVPSSVAVDQASTATVTVTDTDSGTKQYPTGTVAVSSSDGSDTITGTCTLASTATAGVSNCSVTVTPTAFNGGSRTITATFSATAIHLGSSNTATLTVTKRATTTSVSLVPSSVVIGQESTARVTVTDTDSGTKQYPTGTVAVSSSDVSDTITGTCTLANTATLGVSSCSVTVTPTALGSGSRTITATFSATTIHAGSSNTATLMVTKRATMTSVSLSPSSVAVDQGSTATVTVTDTSTGTKQFPTGNVTVGSSDGTDSVTSPCTLASTVNTGVSTCSVTVTPTGYNGGSRTITATFSETAVHLGSSNTAPLTVTRRATSTAVQLTPSTVVTGQSSTVAVTVTDTEPNGTKQYPTGTITVGSSEATDVLTGTCTLANTATAGVSSCSVSVKPIHVATSPHTITATFTQTNVHAGSSNTASLTVNKADTTTTLILTTGTNPSVYGQPLTFQAAVTVNSPGTGAAIGNVTFYNGGGCSSPGPTLQVATALDGSGHATFLTSTLPASATAYTILVCYAGNSDYNASGGSASQTVNPAPTSTTVISNHNPSTFGQTVTFTAQVLNTGTGSTAVPTGTVSFSIDGGTGVPGTIEVCPSAVPLYKLCAAYSTNLLTVPGSPHSVLATYTNSDGNFVSGNGSLFGGQTVNPAVAVAAVTVTPLYYSAGPPATTNSTNPAPADCSGVTAPCQQYSDEVNLNVTVSPGFTNNVYPLNPTSTPAGCMISGNPAPCVNVMVGTVTYGPIPLTLDPSGNLVGTLNNQQILQAPGPYTVSVSPISTVNPNYMLDTASQAGSLAVVQEDAQITYTGPDVFNASSTATSTSVTVSYTLQDATATCPTSGICDPYAGNITKAVVSLSLTGVAPNFSGSCSAPVVAVPGEVDPTNGLPSTGTVTCIINNVPVPGTYSLATTSGTGSYYTFGGDLVVPITTQNGGTGFITGGGHQTASYLATAGASGSGKYTTAGLLKPAAKTKVNFGFEAKYNKSGSNLQGGANIIIRSACVNGIAGYTPVPGDDGLCVYQIKSNGNGNITSLSENLTAPKSPSSAALTARNVTIYDVTRPTALLVASNVTLQLNLYDVAEPGANADTLAIQATDSVNGLWFSNNWSGVTTAISSTAPVIQGGNEQVH